jgi:hypothetical protein
MRFSLPAALIILQLASAATAHAECAWVLWTYGSYSSYGAYWARHDAFESREGCTDFLDREERSAESPKRISETHLRVTLVNGGGALLRCFPDTVDPREPKGK